MQPDPAEPLDALVIGAGFAGMYQLHLLRDRLNFRARVLEQAPGVGGTWFWNRYPGARCDSESHSYCFHFNDDLVREWDWSERYPGQAEILRYMNFVADRLDLRRDIQCDTRVVGARFDEVSGLWVVRTAAGEEWRARFLIAAVGCLSAANVPKIPGLEDFRGRWVHTGDWPEEGVEFTGKRVGLVGTGSTGIQATPVIAEQAAHLTVFQRTPNFSVPARNRKLDPEFAARVKAEWPEWRALMRSNANGHPWLIADRITLATPPEEREALYQAAWDQGGLRFRATFRDMMVDQAANDQAAAFVRAKIQEVVHDPETAAKLTDFDHPFAAKRPPIDSGYFEAFNRPNVRLVDIRATPIVAIEPDGIVTQDEKFPLDIIVFATGFDAMTRPLFNLNLVGRGGLRLEEAWAEGPRTWLGLGVEGFPNLFTITGPGSPSVLTNMPVAIEQHAEWVADCIAWMRANTLSRIEAEGEAAAEWGQHVNQVANATLYPRAASSWYLGANVPGKPRAFMPYLGGMARYRETCAEVAASGYRGFRLG